MGRYLTKLQQIELLKCSVDEWNAYREANPDFVPNFGSEGLQAGMMVVGAGLLDLESSELGFQNIDLCNVNLSYAQLDGADFRAAKLSGANLRYAKFHMTDFSFADLSNADLSESELGGAFFYNTKLTGSKLRWAELRVAHFAGNELHGLDVEGAIFSRTTLSGLDLSQVKNLDKVDHAGPSDVSISTLYKSNFQIPEAFLEGAGVPRQLIDYLPSFCANPIQYYSCFISYSSKDEEFATRVYEGLKSAGIRVWYAPKKMKGGRFLHDQVDQAIRLHDKLLLVLSEDSMNSNWVNTEIYKARKKEQQTGKKVLFPISIVDHNRLMDWECFDADTGIDMARDIRCFYIPDFTGWKDHDSFQAEFKKLVRDLQATEEESS